MPFNCDPCECTENHIRHEPTWRKAVLNVLCQVVTAVGGVAAGIIAAIEAAVVTITSTVYHVIIDAGVNHIGQVSLDAELPAGDEHIGQVCLDCEIPAGTQNIGDVDIASMPAVTLASDTTVDSARKTVAVPGTQEQLASQVCKRVDIMALPTNTDIICVGGANVDAALLTRQGIALNAGQTYSVSVANTNILWIDAVVAGEGVCYNWFA